MFYRLLARPKIILATIIVSWATRVSFSHPYEDVSVKQSVNPLTSIPNVTSLVSRKTLPTLYSKSPKETPSRSLVNRRWMEDLSENKVRQWPSIIMQNNFRHNCTGRTRKKRVHPCYILYTKEDIKYFWSLWSEISMDFKYAFDFILWDKDMSSKKENQFWFLITYLKQLAKMTKHPLNIVLRRSHSADESKWQEIIDKLNEQLTRSEKQLSSWEDKLRAISASVLFYRKEMSTFEVKLNDIVTSLGQIRTHKELMKEVLKELNRQTGLLNELTAKFARVMQTILAERPYSEKQYLPPQKGYQRSNI